ncbi:hypothetical protein F4692_003288 [Nocardioides cavernae]|uniref:Uncharacterized protein n=1 Tax=Nocardioides cavernae TaxID=1921566 RepID=A0A7Y9KUR3_9ACTN|nr:hypothetical protein [Nocardioides cavernae]
MPPWAPVPPIGWFRLGADVQRQIETVPALTQTLPRRMRLKYVCGNA